MWGRTCIPTKVYQVRYPFKRHFRCAQAQHCLVFCWLVVALLRAPGKGTLQGLRPSLPSKLHYWPTVRMVRSEQWEAQAVITDWAAAPRRSLPPPTNGGLYLIGDSTLKAKRGRKPPLGHFTRHGEHDPYQFGFELVVVIARWDRFRVSVALGLIDPQRRGHQSILFRQMLQAVVPPGGGQQVGVVADAGFAAHATLRLMTEQPYAYVLAMPRTRQFTHGTSLRALGQHLPKRCYARRASDKPDGRRHDYGVFVRHATLHNLGDVTIVLSKKRRNDGPKKVKIIVTNLMEAHAGAILSMYAWRWGVEICQSCNLRRTLFGQKFDSVDLQTARRAVCGAAAWKLPSWSWPPRCGHLPYRTAIPTCKPVQARDHP